eukprot:1453597-Pyramimonas_sp.AAC.1
MRRKIPKLERNFEFREIEFKQAKKDKPSVEICCQLVAGGKPSTLVFCFAQRHRSEFRPARVTAQRRWGETGQAPEGLPPHLSGGALQQEVQSGSLHTRAEDERLPRQHCATRNRSEKRSHPDD